MLIDWVDDVRGVAEPGQPLGVDAGRATDVQDSRGRWGQEPRQQLLGTDPFQDAMGLDAQTSVFSASDVIAADLVVHRVTVPTEPVTTRSRFTHRPSIPN